MYCGYERESLLKETHTDILGVKGHDVYIYNLPSYSGTTGCLCVWEGEGDYLIDNAKGVKIG